MELAQDHVQGWVLFISNVEPANSDTL